MSHTIKGKSFNQLKKMEEEKYGNQIMRRFERAHGTTESGQPKAFVNARMRFDHSENKDLNSHEHSEMVKLHDQKISHFTAETRKTPDPEIKAELQRHVSFHKKQRDLHSAAAERLNPPKP